MYIVQLLIIDWFCDSKFQGSPWRLKTSPLTKHDA